MNGSKITELAALRPGKGLRLTSYCSFNFRHLWLHFSEGQMTGVLTSDIRQSSLHIIKAILHYTSFARAGGANLWKHNTFRALWWSRTRHGNRNVFYFHGVPTRAKAYRKSYACVFLLMLLQVRSAHAGETGVMKNRLKWCCKIKASAIMAQSVPHLILSH